jgi:excisionase family DNA binding protein
MSISELQRAVAQIVAAQTQIQRDIAALFVEVQRNAPVVAMRFRDAARYLGVSETTVRRMVSDGRLRTVPNVDGCRLIARVELERFVDHRSALRAVAS